MLKLLSALVAAAGIAGALTLLPGATSTRLSASPPAKSEQVSEVCADKPWPYLNSSESQTEESSLRLLTTDRFTPDGSLLRVSDAQILLEKSQIQDW